MSDMGFSLKPQLSQQQKLSYQMIQSISLLSMPIDELREKIYEEVEKNPVLEIVEDGYANNPLIRKKNDESLYAGSSKDSDDFQSFLENIPTNTQTLQDYLLEQLHYLDLNQDEMSIGEKIIQNLDSNGYHIVSLSKMFPKEIKRIEPILKKIQDFDPIGIACSGLQESLLIQAKKKNLSSLVIYILHDCFSMLEQPKATVMIKKFIKESFMVNVNEIDDAIASIKMLDPFPARNFQKIENLYIAPDVYVEKNIDDGEYVVKLATDKLPIIRVSPDFEDIDDKNSTIKKAIQEGKFFINSIEQRNLTLVKIVRQIIIFQKQFFDQGPSYIKPLRMKDVAEVINVHETTVSRIANSKYLQCEWGLLELKYFFSNAVSISDADSKMMSKESIKQKLKEIIQENDTLSDQKLTDKLAEKGIKIARRTVSKYRAELNINSSYER